MRLDVRHVSFTYDAGTPYAHEALSDVSLSACSGSCLGIMGVTGSGKSTLLELFAGLAKPTDGEVLLDGRDVWADARARRELGSAIGYTFQYPERQFFETSVAREMAFALGRRGIRGGAAADAARSAFRSVGLSYDDVAEASPFALSGGQRRRVAIASVFACAPRALLLDEPTAGLDPAVREQILASVAERRDRGALVVVVSHDADALAAVCDSVAVMAHGSLADAGPVRDMLGDSDRMRGLGVDACGPAVLLRRMREAGLDVACDALSAPDAAERIARALRGRGARAR